MGGRPDDGGVDTSQDVPSVDAMADVRDTDGGPDVPLPTDCEIFVSVDGDNTASGLSAAMALESLSAALETGGSVICVAGGDYRGGVVIPTSLRLRGSFCPGFGTQDSDECLSTIRAPSSWALLVVASDARPVVEIESFHIETGNADPDGGSTYGVRIVESDVTLTNVSIFAKAGADGGEGAAGGTGAQGEGGDDGDLLVPGDPGSMCRPGGLGGRILGGNTAGNNAEGWGDGFGQGGAVGRDGQNGLDGRDAPGTPAASGAGGIAGGFLSSDGFYLPARGEVGAPGVAGFGGGGGGASNYRAGRVGGGGGGGGCGGNGGEGGHGGGGSFDVLAMGSTLVVSELHVMLGNGGDGGPGGGGGGGGGGGSGGDGLTFNSTHGGDGGKGGVGGPGGPGGGGGGGPVAAIVHGNTALTGTPTITGGAGGVGGGSGAGMGATGSREPVLMIDVL